MKSAAQPSSDDEQLMYRLADRVDRLLTQLDELNEVLRRHLERMRSRRRSSKARLASFSQKARKHANHAPS